MSNDSTNIEKKRKNISAALKATGISLLLMVLAYLGVYLISPEGPLNYAVIPFVVAYWLSVIWLSAAGYSKFMGFVAFVSILIPPAVFVVMLLAYSRASGYMKATSGNRGVGERDHNVRREPSL